MVERETKNTQITEIVYDIKSLNYRLGAFFDERRVAVRLDDETHARKQRLQAEKNQRIIDLLIENDNGEDVSVHIVKFKDETFHPFSMNKLGIEASYQNPYNPKYYFKAELSDLRRRGVCEDSLEVIKLLGNTVEQPDEPMNFLDRTARELKRIRETRGVAEDFGSDFVVEALDQISSDIVQRRLIGQRSLLPQFRLEHNTRISRRKDKEYESVRVIFGNRDFEFYWQGKRLVL